MHRARHRDEPLTPSGGGGSFRFSLVCVALALAGCGRPTVVEVINKQDVAVSGLELHVTGNRYPVDALDPGARVAVSLEPTGESGITLVEAATGDTLGTCCYIEPGSGGRMQFTLEADTLRMDSHDSGRVGSIP